MSTTTPKLKLKLKHLATPGFDPAFQRLCEDTMPVPDRFRLALSRQDIKKHADVLNDEHRALVKLHGEPETVVLERRMAKLRESSPENPSIKRIEARLKMLADGKVQSWTVDETDNERMKAFNDDFEKLKEQEFKIALTRKIKLREDSKLTAVEIEHLLDLVELPEEVQAPEKIM